MKKSFLASIYPVAALFVLLATGCVKDQGFEDNEYGINNPAGQPKGVLFQQSRINGRVIP